MMSNTHKIQRDMARAYSMRAAHFGLTPDEYKLMQNITAMGFKWGQSKEILIFTYSGAIPEKIMSSALIPLKVLTNKMGVRFHIANEFIGVERYPGAFDDLDKEVSQ